MGIALGRPTHGAVQAVYGWLGAAAAGRPARPTHRGVLPPRRLATPALTPAWPDGEPLRLLGRTSWGTRRRVATAREEGHGMRTTLLALTGLAPAGHTDHDVDVHHPGLPGGAVRARLAPQQ